MRWVTSLLSPSKNMQFCNEHIRTQPLFSPPCASATYGSARMCRRKNVPCQYCHISSDASRFLEWHHVSWQRVIYHKQLEPTVIALRDTALVWTSERPSSEQLNKELVSSWLLLIKRWLLNNLCIPLFWGWGKRLWTAPIWASLRAVYIINIHKPAKYLVVG